MPRLWLVLLFLAVVDATSDFPNPTPAGKSWAPCSFAADQLRAEGNGSTYGSCLACSPTSAVCPPKCQSLIDALYAQCDQVYAPQDFYFDPAQTLHGFFNDHMDVLRVSAARCGCSGSARVVAATLALLLSALVTVFNTAL